jgi:site-specific DNA-methyltransferase (adenine-specific)
MRYALGMNADTIIIGNCLDVLPTLPAGCAALGFVDPPFNIGLRYPGFDDRQSEDAYLGWLGERLAAVRRVLTPTGALFVAIGRKYQAEVYMMLKRIGFHLRDTIVWAYAFGPAQQRRFTPAWVAIHYATMHPKNCTLPRPGTDTSCSAEG